MRRSGIAQEQMRKTAQTFSRCSAFAAQACAPRSASWRRQSSPPRRPRVAPHSSPPRHARATDASHHRPNFHSDADSHSHSHSDADARSHRTAPPCIAREQRTRSGPSEHNAIAPTTSGLRRRVAAFDKEQRARRTIAMRITITAKNPTRAPGLPHGGTPPSPSSTRARQRLRRGTRVAPHARPASASIARRPPHAPSVAADAADAAAPPPRRSAPCRVSRRSATQRPVAQTKTGRTRRPVRLSRRGGSAQWPSSSSSSA